MLAELEVVSPYIAAYFVAVWLQAAWEGSAQAVFVAVVGRVLVVLAWEALSLGVLVWEALSLVVLAWEALSLGVLFAQRERVFAVAARALVALSFWEVHLAWVDIAVLFLWVLGVLEALEGLVVVLWVREVLVLVVLVFRLGLVAF